MLASSRGFAQGFEEYEETWRDAQEGGPSTDARSTAWLSERLPARDDRPQFVFVNLIGIHNPYDSCGEHCGEFGAIYSGQLVTIFASSFDGLRQGLCIGFTLHNMVSENCL